MHTADFYLHFLHHLNTVREKALICLW